jgi:hypothetical protein
MKDQFDLIETHDAKTPVDLTAFRSLPISHVLVVRNGRTQTVEGRSPDEKKLETVTIPQHAFIS